MFKNKLTNLQNLVAGATATLTIGTGKNAPTLDKLQLVLGGGGGAFDVTMIDAIRGFVNGREFYREGAGDTHNLRRDYLGVATDVSELVLDFTEPNARSAIEQNLSSLPLALMQDCRFEFDINAGAGAALTCEPIAHFRAPTNNPFIKKIRRVTQSFAAGGEQVVYLPNGPSGSKLVRAWIDESVPANITAVELRARNAVGIESSRVALEFSQQHNGLVPQAGIVVLDFIEDGNLSGWFDTGALSDVELRITGTAANVYTIYLEYIDPINHL